MLVMPFDIEVFVLLKYPYAMLYIIAIVNFETCANLIGFVYIIFICCCHMLYMFKYDLVHINYS